MQLIRDGEQHIRNSVRRRSWHSPDQKNLAITPIDLQIPLAEDRYFNECSTFISPVKAIWTLLNHATLLSTSDVEKDRGVFRPNSVGLPNYVTANKPRNRNRFYHVICVCVWMRWPGPDN